LTVVAHSDHGLVIMTADDPFLETLSRAVHQGRAHHETAGEREEHDHDRSTDELGRGELPTHQDQEDDAELDHQVRRREHEHHGGHEVGAFLKQRLCHRGRRIGTTRRHHAESRCTRHRLRAVISEHAFHVVSRHERLHHSGERETQDERPQRLPEHEERLAEAVADIGKADRAEDHDLTIRAIAADASSTFARASPASIASATQCAR
jgi:hypothetical protein